MRISGSIHASAALLALAAVAGCSRDRLTAPPEPHSAAQSQQTPGVLAGKAGRAIVEREARRRAALGDRSMLDSLTAIPVVPAASLADGGDVPDDPSTWGPATIYWARLLLSIGDVQFIFGEMEHNGDVGEIGLSYTLFNASGSVIDRGGPYRHIDWNIFAPLTRKRISYTVPLNLGHACGRTLAGHGDFSSAFSPLPVSLRLEGTTIGPIKLGETGTAIKRDDSEPACQEPQPPDDGDGTGTTGGGDSPSGGETYETWLCVYKDWYWPDGTYWFTETLTCYLVSVETINDQ